VFFSGGEAINQLRGPHEAINVGALMKMNIEQAQHAILRNCQDVIQHGLARKN
jgi:RNase P/RNase MRP subunit p30